MKYFPKLIKIFIFALCAVLLGCKSTGTIKGSTTTRNQIPVINNLFLISSLTDYDMRYQDNISSPFAKAFTEQLTQLNIKSNYFLANDVLSLQQNAGNNLAVDQGYKYVLTIRFYQFNTVDGVFINGDVEARLKEVGKTEAIWVGIFNWRKGCTAFYSSNCTPQVRAQALADTILAGMYKDKIITKMEPASITPSQTPQAQPITNQNKLTIMENSKSKCLDLGFKKDTEAFGNCVLKLSK